MIGACVCLFVGLMASPIARRWTPLFAGLSLLIAGGIVAPDLVKQLPHQGSGLGPTAVAFVKLTVIGVGLLLLMVMAGVPYKLKQTADEIRESDHRGRFEPGNVISGEFFAFLLFSLSGVMLCAGAEDLVWLFLALELTSLPTYVLVAIARDRGQAQEAAVKYFFLGAMSAAIFLYGFTLIYGATGFTDFANIQASIAEQYAAGEGTLPPMLLMGMGLSIIGIGFKIAAFPMHFYTADVYQGAATPVTTMLAFVPKTAGIVAMMLVLGFVGWPLPSEVAALLWVMAVATMTIGNVLGVLQNNVKRALAYSSIAHSGYLLVGLLVGPGIVGDDIGAIGNGLAAVLFYLVTYGVANLGAFAVLGMVRVHGEEAETYDDIANLYRHHPMLATVMAVCVFSLMGLPPMVGFIGKVYLFGAAIAADYPLLVVIALLNAAISGGYYLRIIGAVFFGKPGTFATAERNRPAAAAAVIAMIVSIVLGFTGGYLVAPVSGVDVGVPVSPAPTVVEQTPERDQEPESLKDIAAAAGYTGDTLFVIKSEPAAAPDSEAQRGMTLVIPSPEGATP